MREILMEMGRILAYISHGSEKKIKNIYFISSSNFTFQNVNKTTSVNTFELCFESPPPRRHRKQK